MTDKMREEYEAWVLSEYPNQNMGQFTDGEYFSTTIQYCWLAWQASRLPSGVVSATAWRVIDAKGKRFTVYNKDLAMAISDAGLHVAPMCDVPPEGWECSRVSGHEGPCAASEVTP
ncbi:hypothetical protein [Pseudomonas sp.]|uniref:hypothetical protein n=1 Tax=Pseudomonas sp. TaxID=306 RepID=UPI0032671DE7